jgi:hypothetical protein
VPFVLKNVSKWPDFAPKLTLLGQKSGFSGPIVGKKSSVCGQNVPKTVANGVGLAGGMVVGRLWPLLTFSTFFESLLLTTTSYYSTHIS